jgi:hypothetical protein
MKSMMNRDQQIAQLENMEFMGNKKTKGLDRDEMAMMSDIIPSDAPPVVQETPKKTPVETLPPPDKQLVSANETKSDSPVPLNDSTVQVNSSVPLQKKTKKKVKKVKKKQVEPSSESQSTQIESSDKPQPPSEGTPDLESQVVSESSTRKSIGSFLKDFT